MRLGLFLLDYFIVKKSLTRKVDTMLADGLYKTGTIYYDKPERQGPDARGKRVIGQQPPPECKSTMSYITLQVSFTTTLEHRLQNGISEGSAHYDLYRSLSCTYHFHYRFIPLSGVALGIIEVVLLAVVSRWDRETTSKACFWKAGLTVR